MLEFKNVNKETSTQIIKSALYSFKTFKFANLSFDYLLYMHYLIFKKIGFRALHKQDWKEKIIMNKRQGIY